MHERSDPTAHAAARDEADAMLKAAQRIIAASREAYGARTQQEERAGARRDALRHAAATVRPSMR
jgi:hypothetical protein